jgi:biopolymer transport protein ExbD
MASQARSDEGAITAINVTPLVDVMLVLLAIFMLTAKLADEDSAVPLDLPKAASGEVTQRVLHVAISAEGKRRVDGKDVADDGAFRALAERMQHEHPDVRTIIEASGRADHEHVIAALDTLRLAGITKIAFAVEPKPQAIEQAP